MKILIIDDEQAIRQLWVRLLGNYYPEATLQTHGRIAEAWKGFNDPVAVDLAIVDGQLDGGWGADLVWAVNRRLGPHRFLGVSGDPRLLARLSEAGCQMVLAKPFDVNAALAALDTLLSMPAGGDHGTADAAAELGADGASGALRPRGRAGLRPARAAAG